MAGDDCLAVGPALWNSLASRAHALAVGRDLVAANGWVDGIPLPAGEPTEARHGDLLGEFVCCMAVQVGERRAPLVAEHLSRAVEAVGGPDREVLVDETARAAVLASEGTVDVPDDFEGELEAFQEAFSEGLQAFTERLDVVVRVVRSQAGRVGPAAGPFFSGLSGFSAGCADGSAALGRTNSRIGE
ncbi:hypothetical protein [Streptomyces abikoensis]